jgi:hypothetical protein
VLILLLVEPTAKSDRVDGVSDSKVDTLSFINTIVIRDTITDTLVIYKDRVVKDTIMKHDTVTGIDVYLPIVQQHYSEKGRYDLWISGVEPLNLDMIDIYKEVEYKTITNTVTKTQYVYPKNNEFYLGGGFYSFLDTFTPVVNASLKTKKDALISLNFSRYKGDNIIVGTYSWKIGRNKY